MLPDVRNDKRCEWMDGGLRAECCQPGPTHQTYLRDTETVLNFQGNFPDTELADSSSID